MLKKQKNTLFNLIKIAKLDPNLFNSYNGTFQIIKGGYRLGEQIADLYELDEVGMENKNTQYFYCSRDKFNSFDFNQETKSEFDSFIIEEIGSQLRFTIIEHPYYKDYFPFLRGESKIPKMQQRCYRA